MPRYPGRFSLLFLCLAFAPRVDDPKVNEDLRQELLRMTKLDQDARNEFIEQLKKNPDAGKKSDAPGIKKLETIDLNNTKRMKEIIGKHGWPGRSLVGKDGSHAAWLLIQHADRNLEFQKKCLSLMKQALPKGEVSGQEVAYLTDRVLVAENKKQLYGTQCLIVNGEVKFQPIEDEARVDKRRAEVGLQSLAEYKKIIEEAYLPKKDGKK
jgi:hypothetical protein